MVGNPANTNALIAQRHADGVPAERFTAMTRLDHNRAVAQLADKTGTAVSDISHMAVWGNHSPTMYPDLFNAKVQGASAPGTRSATRPGWPTTYIPRVGKRGAEIIEARGASSAASAANAAIDHVHDWVNGTPEGDWVSMAVTSDGSYGVAEGIISSFPCRTGGRRVRDRPGARRARRSRSSASTRPSRSSSASARPCRSWASSEP